MLNLAAILEDYKYIFHQAGLPSVPRSVKDPRAEHEANITGTVRVRIAVKDADKRQVVFALSSSVRGDAVNVHKNDCQPVWPRQQYESLRIPP
ncbi:MAG: NAD-dependent epimerase/dehydratase family protein [Halobacteriota archaeon]